jgi:MFS family permease
MPSEANTEKPWRQISQLPVLAAALGYLVDMYDLFIFSVVRIPSLRTLGVPDTEMVSQGVYLINMQLGGLLIGGLLWGMLGDKRGRLSVLFGSILLYSLANIANGLVQTTGQYAILRFIAGIGLAGELGAGITLVAELLPQRFRSYGAIIVSTLGVIGAILAFVVADFFDWRVSYIVGGIMGLLLLLLRFKVMESSLFTRLKESGAARGNLGLILGHRDRLAKYLLGIAIGVPMWFVVGVLVTFSPEYGSGHSIDGIQAGKSIMYFFIGQAFGNICSGYLSHYLGSRKKAIAVFMLGSFSTIMAYLFTSIQSALGFYFIITVLGFFNGYWSLFIMVGAELFGTNIRALVATSIPNFVRATAIPFTIAFASWKISLGLMQGSFWLAIIAFGIGLGSLYFLQETFYKEMNYEER